MKILWLVNKSLFLNECQGTGSWLEPLARGLIDSQLIELKIISVDNVKKIIINRIGGFVQVILPKKQSNKNGLPKNTILKIIVEEINQFSPDLVHIWGVEEFWGLLFSRKLVNKFTLLELQGLKFSIAPFYNGGLTISEQIACLGFKEFLLYRTIWNLKRNFRIWGIYEKEIINHCQYISVHSEWMLSQIRAINPKATIFRNNPMIRDEFSHNKKWDYHGNPKIFSSISYPAPFKGLHVLIRSLPLIKREIPNIILHIAGHLQMKGIRQDGYISWLKREILRLNLEKNIIWLGPISAQKTVDELLNCSVFVLPSYIESYSLTLAEALCLGVPTVTAFNGGTSYLAKDNETALFFPPGDEKMCAHQILRILSDLNFSKNLSNNAIRNKKHSNNDIVQNQLNIYKLLLNGQFTSGDK